MRDVSSMTKFFVFHKKDIHGSFVCGADFEFWSDAVRRGRAPQHVRLQVYGLINSETFFIVCICCCSGLPEERTVRCVGSDG